MPDQFGWGAAGLALGAFITGLWAWLVQRKQSDTAVEVAVIAEWEKLTAALSARLAAVEMEFAEHRTRVSRQFEEMHEQHTRELDEMRKVHRAEMQAMRDLNEGLQRQIAQNSQSAAYLMGNLPERDSDNGN